MINAKQAVEIQAVCCDSGKFVSAIGNVFASLMQEILTKVTRTNTHEASVDVGVDLLDSDVAMVAEWFKKLGYKVHLGAGCIVVSWGL